MVTNKKLSYTFQGKDTNITIRKRLRKGFDPYGEIDFNTKAIWVSGSNGMYIPSKSYFKEVLKLISDINQALWKETDKQIHIDVFPNGYLGSGKIGYTFYNRLCPYCDKTSLTPTLINPSTHKEVNLIDYFEKQFFSLKQMKATIPFIIQGIKNNHEDWILSCPHTKPILKTKVVKEGMNA